MSQVRRSRRYATTLHLSPSDAHQLSVFNDIGDPSFILGGWATAEFKVSKIHDKWISGPFWPDPSNGSFPPILI